jgi:hypothetical protein
MSLDEGLERMRRWEALRRRMAGPGRGEPVVEELIEAIGAVLHRHGEVTVTLSVEGTAEPVTLRLHWQDGHLQVASEVSPAEPVPETPEQTAARLAELIRQDPSVLRPRRVTD